MQKRLICFSALIFTLAFSSNAQFKKGYKMFGASVGNLFYNSGSGDQKVTNIGNLTYNTSNFGLALGPSAGWFISDKTAIGASLNINPTSQKTSYKSNGTTFQRDENKGFNIGLGGFVRNYFTGSGSFLPFGQIGVNAGINTTNTNGFFYGGSGSSAYKETYDGKSSGGFFLNSTINLGLTKMVGEMTGLDFYVGYNFSYNKNTFKTTRLRDEGNNGTIETRGENETITNFTNHGFILGVGFQVFLNGKKK